jgi:hypothetical protein
MLPISHTLVKPVTHAGKTYTEIVIDREPTVGDLAAMDEFSGDIMKTVAVIASLSGVPIPAIKAIAAREFGALADKVTPLLGNAQ